MCASGVSLTTLIATKSMATRENLKKLNIEILKQLAREHNIETRSVKKEDLISSLLELQLEPSALTPVRPYSGDVEPNVGPDSTLPPFNTVKYNAVSGTNTNI